MLTERHQELSPGKEEAAKLLKSYPHPVTSQTLFFYSYYKPDLQAFKGEGRALGFTGILLVICGLGWVRQKEKHLTLNRYFR